MVIILKTSSIPTPPMRDLGGLLAGLKERYAWKKNVIICEAWHESRYGISSQKTGDVTYSGRMEEKATQLFRLLQESAKEGKTSIAFSFQKSVVDEVLAETAAVLNCFREKMDLNFRGEKAKLHSLLCELNNRQVDILVSWDSHNTFLNPKPMLRLDQPRSWGTDLLNAQRREGHGDCTLDFGGKQFPAHRLIVESFSPVMKAALQLGMQESETGLIQFPQAPALSPKALDAFIELMYTQKIDFNQFPIADAILLLEFSHFLNSEALKKSAFEYLYERADQLDSRDLLQLFFLRSEHSFDQLNQLCDWLFSGNAQFYKAILVGNELSSEELVMLFAIAKHLKISELISQLQGVWGDMPTAQKVTFAQAALAKRSHKDLFELVCELCKATVGQIPKEDPSRTDFIRAYKDVSNRIVELETES